MFCKYCGKELANDVKFCSRCGKQLFYDSVASGNTTKNKSVEDKPVNTKKFCENCGEELIDGAKFCLACGSPAAVSNSAGSVNQNSQPSSNRFSQFETNSKPEQYSPTQSPKSRLVAALLAFFLGEFGAHRFYVEKTGSGVAQILLSLSFIVSIFCFAEVEEEIGFFFLLLGLVWVIWVIVDFIMILCGSFKDKDNLPLVNWNF